MSGTLLDLARDYEREVPRCIRWQDREDRRDTADLFRRMVCNRVAADPTRLTITLSMLLDIPNRWCRQHGYRAIAGAGGFIVQRGNEPALLAAIGDTLLWDGEQITIAP